PDLGEQLALLALEPGLGGISLGRQQLAVLGIARAQRLRRIVGAVHHRGVSIAERPSLRAQRSNPGVARRTPVAWPWIASSLALLAMTGWWSTVSPTTASIGSSGRSGPSD